MSLLDKLKKFDKKIEKPPITEKPTKSTKNIAKDKKVSKKDFVGTKKQHKIQFSYNNTNIRTAYQVVTGKEHPRGKRGEGTTENITKSLIKFLTESLENNI